MHRLSRRSFLQVSGVAVSGLVLGSWTAPVNASDSEGSLKYPYELPKLPYAPDALEPAIDKETMMIHHGKHHQTYVDNLNKALADHPELQKKTLGELLRGLDKIPESIRTTVRNNGGGHMNHSMFWKMMGKGGGKPTGDLAKAIDTSFGSFDKFKEAFAAAAKGQFGSGWAWLVAGKDKLSIAARPNQDTPAMEGMTPILGIDVWEHAYYLKYKNKRDDYIKAWWDVVNWKDVADRYTGPSMFRD